MNTAFRVLAVLLVVGVLAGIGVAVYNAGVSQGVAQQLVTATASGAPTVVYPGYPGYYGHWGFGGFGFFGIFFWILGIFLIFALIRAAFGWGRWGGRGGPGGWRGGYGYGHHGPGDPRREMLDEWHREAHGDKPSEPGGGSGQAASAG
jgi:hypothetical protein